MGRIERLMPQQVRRNQEYSEQIGGQIDIQPPNRCFEMGHLYYYTAGTET